MGKVTSVQFSPNGDYIASGDDKGKVKIWSYDEASKAFIVKKEHQMLAGPVHALTWTEDGQRLAAGGEGKDMLAKAVLADSGTKIGDLFGPSKTVLSVDLKPKPYRLVLSGENNEVYVFDGVPFKHAKTINQHTNFVNKVAFRPTDGAVFVTVSSDKSIILHDSESLEVIRKIEKAHNKGIMDVNWVDSSTIATSSTDNEIKFWNIETGSEIR
jgi:WD40 repeat protein